MLEIKRFLRLKQQRKEQKDGHMWMDSIVHSLAHSKLQSNMQGLDLRRKMENIIGSRQVLVSTAGSTLTAMFAWTACTCNNGNMHVTLFLKLEFEPDS